MNAGTVPWTLGYGTFDGTNTYCCAIAGCMKPFQEEPLCSRRFQKKPKRSDPVRHSMLEKSHVNLFGETNDDRTEKKAGVNACYCDDDCLALSPTAYQCNVANDLIFAEQFYT